jgi:ribosomal protein L37AE/L43A
VSERAAPFYCPYCGDEDLRPHEEGHGAWLCGACRRAFSLKYLGLVFREAGPADRAEQADPLPTPAKEAK